MRYVKNGMRSEDCEFPSYSKPKSEDEEDPDKAEDWEECVALGTLREAQPIMFGLTVAEAKKMTRDELLMAMQRAYLVHGFGGSGKGEYELGNYYRTVDEIKNRLSKENLESK